MVGRKSIQDEFTNLSISRQRKWQLRKRKEGRCEVCGDVAVDDRCETHHITLALAQLRHRGAPTIQRRGKWLLKARERGE